MRTSAIFLLAAAAVWLGFPFGAPGVAASPGVKSATSRNVEARRPSGTDSWSAAFTAPPSGQGVSSSINALLPFGGGLVAGGDFVDAGSTRAYRVASWDGSSWSPIGSHGVPCRVFALAEYQGDLIAAGTTVQGMNILRWNGSAWAVIPGGPQGMILALAEFGGDLYVGGSFGIRSWNGTSWSSLDDGVDGTVFCLAVHQGELFAGGRFTEAGNYQPPVLASSLARWNGSLWRTARAGANGDVQAMHSRNDSLFVGGRFSSVAISSTNIVPAARIALWIGGGTGTWNASGPFGAGVVGNVQTLSSFGTQLVVGGDFTSAGGLAAGNIATWESGGWDALGGGVGGTTYVPMVKGSAEYLGGLYVGGRFQSAGGSPSNFIARWGPVVPRTTSAPLIAASGADDFALRARANPVRSAEASFELTGRVESPIEYAVYDVHGRRLWQSTQTQGPFVWDTRARDGGRVSNGTYFLAAQSGTRFASTSFVVLR